MKLNSCLAGALLLLVATGCDSKAPQDSVRLQVEPAPDYMQPVVGQGTVPAELSEAAQATIAELEAIIQSNSLTRLSRFADAEPSFLSNFAGASHRDHWDLLRRTGFDPILTLEKLFDGPYGVKSVSGEAWYVWPELAALDPDQLQPERLNFSQRARLAELVGETGIAQIRAGSGYPGVRTAIAEDGRWLYFVHETSSED
ncbi:MAG: hypothetical protein RLN72_07530 [Henriciella sp.]